MSQNARAAMIAHPATGPTTAPAIQPLLPELSEPCAAFSKVEVALATAAVTDVPGVAVAVFVPAAAVG